MGAIIVGSFFQMTQLTAMEPEIQKYNYVLYGNHISDDDDNYVDDDDASDDDDDDDDVSYH